MQKREINENENTIPLTKTKTKTKIESKTKLTLQTIMLQWVFSSDQTINRCKQLFTIPRSVILKS